MELPGRRSSAGYGRASGGVLEEARRRSEFPFPVKVTGRPSVIAESLAGDTEFLARFGPRLFPTIAALTAKLGDDALSDVTLCVDGVELHCHRLLLACSSEYFSRMFEGSFAESQERPRVELPGKSVEAVRAVLRVMYFDATVSQVLAEDQSRVLQLLDLAHEWLLPDVADACVEYVRSDVHDGDLLAAILDAVHFREDMRRLRDLCFERLRLQREAAAAAEVKRLAASRGLPDQGQPQDSSSSSRMSATDDCRDQWAPIQCPRGLGW
mmetsp:Transcript_36/g.129  ORF Transcript_36/g.129 Transcript_36/m.129 type:complete len:268 (+) Transcript_36:1-804(+)